VDDGIAALMRIIENPGGRATRQIYNVGNPVNNFSIRELAQMMLALAAGYDEYRDNAKKVKLITTTSDAYYGSGYQDIQNRVPKIENTMADLNSAPVVSMPAALRHIFDAYRDPLAYARDL
jgi:nucleoside-diphosphate-sugar epimerase